VIESANQELIWAISVEARGGHEKCRQSKWKAWIDFDMSKIAHVRPTASSCERLLMSLTLMIVIWIEIVPTSPKVDSFSRYRHWLELQSHGFWFQS
jgi:hypothetical protein